LKQIEAITTGLLPDVTGITLPNPTGGFNQSITTVPHLVVSFTQVVLLKGVEMLVSGNQQNHPFKCYEVPSFLRKPPWVRVPSNSFPYLDRGLTFSFGIHQIHLRNVLNQVMKIKDFDQSITQHNYTKRFYRFCFHESRCCEFPGFRFLDSQPVQLCNIPKGQPNCRKT